MWIGTQLPDKPAANRRTRYEKKILTALYCFAISGVFWLIVWFLILPGLLFYFLPEIPIWIWYAIQLDMNR